MIGRNLSLYLDFWRVVAALTVFVSHLAYPRFTQGDYILIRDLNLGSDAVVLFFVISGFVIAYVSDKPDLSGRRFAFDRLTRLYSVAAPAVVFTLLADAIGVWVAPDAYSGWWHHAAPLWQSLTLGLSFSSEWFGSSFRLGSNGPFWSLSYEAGYYLLFGILVFAKGAWRWGAIVVAVALGPNILLLAPSWIFGVLAYRVSRRSAQNSVGIWLMLILPIMAYPVLLFYQAPYLLGLATLVVFGWDFTASLGFSDEFVWNGLVGALFAMHLIAVARLCSGLGELSEVVSQPHLRVLNLRWWAGASFSIYLVHYPALQLLIALFPSLRESWAGHVMFGAAGLAICLVFAACFERRLPQVRAFMLSLLPSRSNQPLS
ncbi:MAG: acyltransferase family protein [Pikeienuella sp.]